MYLFLSLARICLCALSIIVLFFMPSGERKFGETIKDYKTNPRGAYLFGLISIVLAFIIMVFERTLFWPFQLALYVGVLLGYVMYPVLAHYEPDNSNFFSFYSKDSKEVINYEKVHFAFRSTMLIFGVMAAVLLIYGTLELDKLGSSVEVKVTREIERLEDADELINKTELDLKDVTIYEIIETKTYDKGDLSKKDWQLYKYMLSKREKTVTYVTEVETITNEK